MQFESEEQIARVVTDWLHADGWVVHQEVSLGSSEPCIDIVARRGPLLWAIEVKRALSLAVIGQAHAHIGRAHFVSVAVPSARHAGFADVVLTRFGIGLLHVHYDTVTVPVRAPLHRRITSCIASHLVPQQTEWAPAGNSEGRRWTPFQQTAENLREIVRIEPGIRFRDAMARLKHHYSSDTAARCALRQWILRGLVRGMRLRHEGHGGRTLRLYLTTQ